jgi:very-short-patch-repair endonuclease
VQVKNTKTHPVDGARAQAHSLRRNVTGVERRVWQILRSHRTQGYKFCRQVPIGRYVGDFVCHEGRLVVEIDGGQHVAGRGRGVYETIAAELAASPPPKPSPVKGEGFC